MLLILSALNLRMGINDGVSVKTEFASGYREPVAPTRVSFFVWGEEIIEEKDFSQ